MKQTLIESGKVPGATTKQPDANNEIRSQAGEGFIKGTRVHTKDGLNPIEEIKVGDWVLTQPKEGGERTYKRVTRTTRFEDAPVWAVTYFPKAELEKARAEGRMMQGGFARRIVVTPNHPLQVRGRGWVQVKDIDYDGDELELSDGQSALVERVCPLYKTETESIAWQEGMFTEWAGSYIYLSNPNSVELDAEYSESKVVTQPPSIELWSDNSYFRCSVYNVEVEDCHTYYVGGEYGFWVHSVNREGVTSTKNAQCLPHARCVDNEQCDGNIEGKGACFVAGTLVHTREGLKPIEQIKVGDYVLSKPESGEGEVAYKCVVRTIERDDCETWFVSWFDPKLHEDWVIKRITSEEYLKAHGNSFVITTPNHPFWVVESNEEYLKYSESDVDLGMPWPRRHWLRADQLQLGMKLLLADGRVVELLNSAPVYKTDKDTSGWVNTRDHEWGFMIDFDRNEILPRVPFHLGGVNGNDFYGLEPNPNPLFGLDYPIGVAKESWYRTKVYTFEVEECHTYFVDRLGVWVHNTNCFDSSVESSQAGEGFIKGTRVHMKDGLKLIEEIKVGDWVLTQPGEGGERTYKRVTRTTRFEDAVVWSVFYLPNAERERAKAEGRKVQKESYRRLVITPNHPLWVKGKGWVQVKDLNFDGDEFELCNGDNAGLVQVSPLYRSHTDDIAWQEGIFDETDGQLIDLRNGAPGEFDVFRQQLFQPDFVELWDESCYYRCPVYNFEVEDCHTCYIGAEGVWVNNSNCEGTTSTKNAQNLPDARCVDNEQREGNTKEKGACFVAGTLVHTREGLKSIEQIKVGDWVLTQPESTGERTYRKVTRTVQFENTAVWTATYFLKAELEQARAEQRMMRPDCEYRLVVTPNHPFWVKGKGWVQMKDLDIDIDELELADGQIALLSTAYPLYRTETEGVAWEEGMFVTWDGTLYDLRQGCSAEKMFRSTGAQRAVQPEYVERWDESSFFRCSVYNIEVEEFHTYYVGELGVWVHNSNCSENSPSQMEQPMSVARRSTQAGGCFINGTYVHTKDGLKPIEEIKVGDWVLTQPEEVGERTYKRVIQTSCCEDVPVWSLTYFRSSELERAKAENRLMPLGLHRRLVVTPSHPLWVRDKGWVQVKDLDFDSDELLLSDGEYALLLEISPLYRTGTAGVAWQADTVISKTGGGQLLDLRNGASAEFEEYRDEADPQSFSYWDESCYIQKIKLSDGSYVYGQEAMKPRDIEEWNESFYYRCTVYNFEVEDCHTYYVGTEGVWAHNTRGCGQFSREGAAIHRTQW